MSVVSGHTYFLINQKSGTAFDLSGANNRFVNGYQINRTKNQMWKFINHPDGWTIQNGTGKFLDVDHPGVYNDGEKMVAVDTPHPRKFLVNLDKEFYGYRIVIPGTTKCADLSDNGNPTNNTPITLWGEWKGQNQVWRLEPVD